MTLFVWHQKGHTIHKIRCSCFNWQPANLHIPQKWPLRCFSVCDWFLVQLLYWLGVLSTSLLPIAPFDDPLKKQIVTREVEEFVPTESAQFAFPFTTYVNHVYVHPRSLKYDGQKAFAKVCCPYYFIDIVLFTCFYRIMITLNWFWLKLNVFEKNSE